MSLAAALGEASPPSSGRSSPVPRATRRAVEDGIYKADKSLKRYATAIERALATWEVSPEEWADYIAFLARLLKAIQTHPRDAPILPHSSAIATRLAQCLNPALPAGVHQKALEVYSYLFATFGDEYIAGHLHEFLPGLSAALGFVQLSVRPGVYSLFEDHIVTFSPVDLRPALKSLILGLLPALEEENSEDFERAFNILQSFEMAFTPRTDDDDLAQEMDGYFWQCLFLAIITSSSRRQGALNYLVRRLPPLTPRASGEEGKRNQQLSREAQCIVSPEPGLLIRCFVRGLYDPQVLIQRGFLDLLVTHLPLNSVVLQEKVGNDDLDRLVSAATQVLMRRDMSLNRRVWSWFLGPEPKEAGISSRDSSPTLERKPSSESNASLQLRYFSNFGRASLERCVLKMLQDPTTEATRKARPFRICLSLMDRWEIGGLLMPQIFLPAMRALYGFSLRTSPAETAEVVRSASLFFDGVEASLIWDCLLGILHDKLEQGQSPEPTLDLFDWIISTFNIKDEEMLNIHIPFLVMYLLSSLDSLPLTESMGVHMLKCSIKLLDAVPPRVFRPSKDDASEHSSPTKDDPVSRRRTLANFYRGEHRSAATPKKPYTPSSVLRNLYSSTISIFSKSLASCKADTLTKATTLLLAIISKEEPSESVHDSPLQQALLQALHPGQHESLHMPFPIVQSVIALLSIVGGEQSKHPQISSENLLLLEPALTASLWEHMSPELPKYHVEAVKAFWQLEQIISPNDALIASVTALVRDGAECSSKSTQPNSEKYRRFMVLWGHSIPAGNPKLGIGRRGSGISVLTEAKHIQRALHVLEKPLLLALETLDDTTAGAFDVVKGWLQVLGSLESVFALLFQHFVELASKALSQNQSSERHVARIKEDNLCEMNYLLDQFHNILLHGSQWTWRCLSKSLIQDPSGTETDGFVLLAELCVNMLFASYHSSETLNRRLISVLSLLLTGPTAVQLKALELDARLLDRLMACIEGEQRGLQGGMLKLVQLALKLRLMSNPSDQSAESQRRISIASKRPSITSNSRPTTGNSLKLTSTTPPPQLFKCVRMGFSSRRTRFHLDQWLMFLEDILPTFADAIFSNLLPLVECFCEELAKAHKELAMLSQRSENATALAPENVAMSLLEGLEMVLDRAYECLVSEAAAEPTPKESDPKPSFLTNVTAGVFKAEGPPSRTTKSNSRLTVILALQDSVRTAMSMWLWASSSTEGNEFDSRSAATTAYYALKVRNKTRHLLEQIFSVEMLESLEVVITHWCSSTATSKATSALSLLHVMQVTRPKNVVPAVLDALCSRTNPTAIPSARHSSLTIDLSPSDVATFLSAYLNSTEDDAMDELWSDCLAFLRDVLTNPLPYRQVLPHLLSIILLLAEKLSNTNFGEQRKMRRELGDIFQRVLTATFTTLPSGYTAELTTDGELQNGDSSTRRSDVEKSMTLVPVLNRVTGKLDVILETPERTTVAVNNITASLLSPTFRTRSFPKNINGDFLALVVQMTRKAPLSKHWKKEVSDAFYDPKILASSPELMTDGWFALLHQWAAVHDKERFPDLLSRLTPPTSAGIMFGVGASAARLEADRRTQLTVRRLCLLLLASPEDTYVAHLRPLEEKLAELFEASPSSSPSAAIKAELFMLCRTIALSVSTAHLAPIWPIVNDNLQAALSSLMPRSQSSDNFNNVSLLQACKLLDLLLVLSPDEFQLHEWLYITDTIDAVYQPGDWGPAALSDQIAEALGNTSAEDSVLPTAGASGVKRRMLLTGDLPVDKDDIKALPREDFVQTVLRPFLSQLSIHAYEGVYSMDSLDVAALRRDVLADILDTGSIVE